MTAPAGRLGLTLTGGSCRCAFQAGVLQALDERGIRFSGEDGSVFKNMRDRAHTIPEALRDCVRVIHPSRPMPVTFNDLDRGRITDALDHGYEVGRVAVV